MVLRMLSNYLTLKICQNEKVLSSVSFSFLSVFFMGY